jgi:hypothetical protein
MSDARGAAAYTAIGDAPALNAELYGMYPRECVGFTSEGISKLVNEMDASFLQFNAYLECDMLSSLNSSDDSLLRYPEF